MQPDDMGPRGIFRQVSTEECWRLVASEPVGRLAFVVDSMPKIFPLNHSLHDGAVYFRTSAYGEIARSVAGKAVAFEVDHIYSEDWSGWSVLITGIARRVDDSTTLAALWSPHRMNPWAEGSRKVWIEIDPHEVTGRMVRA